MRHHRRYVVRVGAAVAFLASANVLAPSAPAEAAERIIGGGSSFAALFHDAWVSDVGGPPLSLAVDYTPSGSTQGRSDFAGGRFDYAGSDTPYLPREPRPNRDFVYVPVMAGGLSFMFNLTGLNGQAITDLNLDSSAVCRMFTDPLMKWNDPAIVGQNPALAAVLPDETVKPIVRDDSSGTSYVLSEYCIATNPQVWSAFQNMVRGKPEVYAGAEQPSFDEGKPISDWPTGWGNDGKGFGSDGVADIVNQGYDQLNGKITYVEYGASLRRNRPAAKMRNGGGAYVLPVEPNVEIALGYATPNVVNGQVDGTFTLAYAANNAQAYFPSTYSYVVAPLSGSPGKLETLTKYLQYAVSSGQGSAYTLGYDPLSCVIANLALTQTAKIPGAATVPSPCDANQQITSATQIDAAALTPGGSGSSTGIVAGTAGAPAGAAADQSGQAAAQGAAPAGQQQQSAGSATGGQAGGSTAGATGGTGATGAATVAQTGTSTDAAPGAEAATGAEADASLATAAGAAAPDASSAGLGNAAAASAAASAGTGSRRASLPVGGGAQTAGGGTNAALLAANQAPGLGGSGDGRRGPSNAEVLWTLLAGAALAAAGLFFARQTNAPT